MNVKSIFFFVLLLCSCDSEAVDQLANTPKIAQNDLNDSFIQLIPWQGMVVNSDSILLHKSTVAQVLALFDTTLVPIELTINEPRVLVCSTSDSPPAGYTGEYKHKPDEYSVDCSATINIDRITLSFYHKYSGKDIYEKGTYTDSLRLICIEVSEKSNVGLYADLKIGDDYKHIFDYYEKPTFICNPNMIRSRHSENGVVFTIETNAEDSVQNGKITSIEINRLTKY